jgi:hypothetical protein
MCRSPEPVKVSRSGGISSRIGTAASESACILDGLARIEVVLALALNDC